jgi:Tfp pilus assembly protein PilO
MNKNALYVVLFLGLGFYYAYDTYYPQYLGWETEIAELQEKISAARANAPKLAEIRDEEAALKERLRLSLEKLPSASELSDLLVMVIPIFERAGILSDQIASKNVGGAAEKDIYREHPIQIGGIKGLSMEKIVRLLFELRTFHRIVNVNSFNIARTGPDEYDLGIDIVTYSYIAGEDEDLSSSAPPPPPPPPSPATTDTGTPEIDDAEDTATSAVSPDAETTSITPAVVPETTGVTPAVSASDGTDTAEEEEDEE